MTEKQIRLAKLFTWLLVMGRPQLGINNETIKVLTQDPLFSFLTGNCGFTINSAILAAYESEVPSMSYEELMVITDNDIVWEETQHSDWWRTLYDNLERLRTDNLRLLMPRITEPPPLYAGEYKKEADKERCW